MDALVVSNFHVFLDGVVLDLQRCLLRLQKARAEQAHVGSTESTALTTQPEGTDPSPSAPSFSVDSESAFATPARSRRGGRRKTRAALMSAGIADERKAAEPPRRQARSAQSTKSGRAAAPAASSLLPPLTPLSAEFRPLLDHATSLTALHTGLESDSLAILPTLDSYDPRRCAGVQLSFPHLHELLVHHLVLDPTQQHTNTAVLCDFLMTWCSVEMLSEEQSFDKAIDATAQDIARAVRMGAVDSIAPPLPLLPPRSASDNSAQPHLRTPPLASPALAVSANPLSSTRSSLPRAVAGESASRTAAAGSAVRAAAAGASGGDNKDAGRLQLGRSMPSSLIRAITGTIFALITTCSQPLTSEPWYTFHSRPRRVADARASPLDAAPNASAWQRVWFPKQLKPSTVLRQVERAKLQAASSLAATPVAEASARHSMKCAMTSLHSLTAMLNAILLKNSNESATSVYARKRLASIMIACRTADVLAGTLQWLDLNAQQSNRLGLLLITSAARVLDSVLKMDLLYGLRGEHAKKKGASKGRTRGRRVAQTAAALLLEQSSAAQFQQPAEASAAIGEEEMLEGEEDAMVEDVEPEDGVDDDAMADGAEDDEDDDNDAHDEEVIVRDERDAADAMGLGDVITVADNENEDGGDDDEDEDDNYGVDGEDEDVDEDEDGEVDGMFDDEDEDDEDDDDPSGIDLDDEDEEDEDDDDGLDDVIDDLDRPASDRSDSEAENEEQEANEADVAAADEDEDEDEENPHEADGADADEEEVDEEDGEHGDLSHPDAGHEDSDSFDGHEGGEYGDAEQLDLTAMLDTEERGAADSGEQDEDDDAAFQSFVVPNAALYADDEIPDLIEADDAGVLQSRAGAASLDDVIEVSREEADRMSDDLQQHNALYTADGYQNLLTDSAPRASSTSAHRPPSRRSAYRVVRQHQQEAGISVAPQDDDGSGAAQYAAPEQLTSMRLRRSPALSDIHAEAERPHDAAAEQTDAPLPGGVQIVPRSGPAQSSAAGSPSAAQSAALAHSMLGRLDAHRAQVEAAISRVSGRSFAQSPFPPSSTAEDGSAGDSELEQERARYLRMAIQRNQQQRAAGSHSSHRHARPAGGASAALLPAEEAALNDIDRIGAQLSSAAASASSAPSSGPGRRRGGVIGVGGALRPSQRSGHVARARVSLNPHGPLAASLAGHPWGHLLNPVLQDVLNSVAVAAMHGRGPLSSLRGAPSSSRPMYLGSSLVLDVSARGDPAALSGGDGEDGDEDRLANGGNAAGVLMEDDDDADANDRDALYAGESADGLNDDRSDGSDEGDDQRRSAAPRWSPSAMPTGRLANQRRPQPAEAVRHAMRAYLSQSSDAPQPHPASGIAARRAHAQSSRSQPQQPTAASSAGPQSGRSALISGLRSDLDAGWLEFDPLASSAPRPAGSGAQQQTLDPSTFALVHNVLVRALDLASTVHIKVRKSASRDKAKADADQAEHKDKAEDAAKEAPVSEEKANEAGPREAEMASSPGGTEGAPPPAPQPAAMEEEEDEERQLEMALSLSLAVGSCASASSQPMEEADSARAAVAEESATMETTPTAVAVAARAASSESSSSHSALPSSSATSSTAAPSLSSAHPAVSTSLSSSSSSSAAALPSSSSAMLSTATLSAGPAPPPPIDAAFLAELPADLRYEVLEQHNREFAQYRQAEMRRRAALGEDAAAPGAGTGASFNAASSMPSASSSSGSGVDEEFLAALPPELREEVLLEHSMRRRSSLSPSTSLSAVRARAAEREMDTSTFIQTLTPDVREDFLLSQDESFLFTLPSPLLAEALALRNRNSSSVQRQQLPTVSSAAAVRAQPTYTAATRRVMNVLGGAGGGGGGGGRGGSIDGRAGGRGLAQPGPSSSPSSAAFPAAGASTNVAAAPQPPALSSSSPSSESVEPREQPNSGLFPRLHFSSFASVQRRLQSAEPSSLPSTDAVVDAAEEDANQSPRAVASSSPSPSAMELSALSSVSELHEQRAGHSLLSTPLLVPVVRVLYMIPINEAQISVIQRIAHHLITMEPTRHTFLAFITAILRTAYVGHSANAPKPHVLRAMVQGVVAAEPEVQRMLQALPRGRVLGAPEEIQLGITEEGSEPGAAMDSGDSGGGGAVDQSLAPPPPPTVVVLRLIDLVRFLISKMPYLVTLFFFKASAASSFALSAANEQPQKARLQDDDGAASQHSHVEEWAESKAAALSTPMGRPPLPPSSTSGGRRRARKTRRSHAEAESGAPDTASPSKRARTSITASPSTPLIAPPASPAPGDGAPLIARPAAVLPPSTPSTALSTVRPKTRALAGSPLLELFAMFSSPAIVSSSRCVYYLTRMLADLLELPCKHIAEVQAYRARKDKKRRTAVEAAQAYRAPPVASPTSNSAVGAGPVSAEAKAPGEEKEREEKRMDWGEAAYNGLLYRDAHLDLPYALPPLPPWCIRAFLLTLTSDGYTERCMELACKVLLMMAERADNNEAIVRELGRVCVELTQDIDRDLRHAIAAEQERLRAKGLHNQQQVALRSASPAQPPAGLSDSQKKRKRGSGAGAAPPSPSLPSSSPSTSGTGPSTLLSSSAMWRLTIREAALLRFIRLLNTLNLIDAPSSSSAPSSASASPPSPSSSAPVTSAVAHSSSTVKLPSSAPAPSVLTPARVESGKAVLAQLGLFPVLRSLWRQLDRFLSIVENAEGGEPLMAALSSTPSTPSAGGGAARKADAARGKDEKKEAALGRFPGKETSTSSKEEKARSEEKASDQLQARVKDLLSSKKVQDTRSDLTEEGSGAEAKESDVLLLMHLPLLECFFIVCAPRLGEMHTTAASPPETANTSTAQTPAMTPTMTPRKTVERAESAGLRPSLSSTLRAAEEQSPSLRVDTAHSMAAPVLAPSSELSFYLEFSSRHRRVLNVCCRQQPSLLKSVTGAFHSLVWHPGKILDFDIRRKYFKSEMKKLAVKQRQANPTASASALRLHVRRDTIFEDSYAQLERYAVSEWKNKLHVKFFGEEGLDAGGLSREWFLLLSREIFNPAYALFKPAANNPAVFTPNKYSYWNPDHLSYFKFVGRFVGKALHDGTRLDAYFARPFLKHVLGLAPSFHDLENVDMAFYNNLVWMLQNDIDGVLDDLTFSVESDEFGRMEVVDLVPQGRRIPVTNANKLTYVTAMADFILTRSIQPQIDAFLAGFRDLIPASLLIFNEHELELLLCGLPSIDLHDLQAHIEYRGYTAKDQAIQWFWSIAHEMSQQEKALLMLFVTGTSKIPLEGFKALQGANGINPFTIQKAEGVDALPLAHTCFNTLDLPDYSSLEVMRSKVMYAIKEGSQGFGFR